MAASKSRASGRSNRREAPEPEDLLITELRDIHSAEKQLSKALPKLSKAVQNEGVREALDRRLEEGQRLTEEVEQALESLDAGPSRQKNPAAEGLIADAQDNIQEFQAGPELDAMLIGAVQKTTHYCIAAWGTAKAFAKAIGDDTVVSSMQRALDEGKSFDQELTRLAEDEVTPAIMDQYEEIDAGAGEDMAEA